MEQPNPSRTEEEEKLQQLLINFDPNQDLSWLSLYQNQFARWDLGGPSPNLQRLIRTWIPSGKRILVPGCGFGNDAIALAQAGYEVYALDFVEEALIHAKVQAQQRGVSLEWVHQDLFEEKQEWNHFFDAWAELTCFCAIDPKKRKDYLQQVTRWLKPEGLFVGIFYVELPPPGPPYHSSPEEIRLLFEKELHFLHFERSPDSVERRKNHEWEGVFRKR